MNLIIIYIGFEKDLKKLCDGADIKKGLSIPGANVYDAKDIVAHWVAE